MFCVLVILMSFFSKNTRENNKISFFTALKCTARAFVSASAQFSSYVYEKKHARWALFLLLCLVSIFAFVFVRADDKTKVTFESLNIFPDVIESNGWENVHTLYSQDLGNDSLYIDFNAGDAATLAPEQIIEMPFVSEERSSESVVEGDDTETGSTMSEDNTVVPEAVNEESASDSTSQLEGVADDTMDASIEDPASFDAADTVPEEGSGDTVDEMASALTPQQFESSEKAGFIGKTLAYTQSVFSNTYKKLIETAPFAIETDTTPIETVETNMVSEPQSDFGIEEEVQSDGENAEVAGASEISETDLTEDDYGTDDATTGTSDVTEEVVDSKEETGGDDTHQENIESAGETGTSTSEEEIDEDETMASDTGSSTAQQPIAVQSQYCTTEEACNGVYLDFSGFSVPPFDDSVVIDGTQIRLSFGAKQLSSMQDMLQQVQVWYSFDATNWSEAGSVIIEDEVSNSLNGGYFLFALPEIRESDTYKDLTVRLVYHGDPEGLHGMYVDSLWLEVNALSFYEPEEAQFTDEIEYSRELALPTYNDLVEPVRDFTGDELPSFQLRYNSQKNIFSKIARALFGGERSYDVRSARLTHVKYPDLDLPLSITYHEDGTWTAALKGKPQKIRPGKYKLTIEIEEDEEIYIDEMEFYWGVLAVNTRKSMYHQNEEVEFNLAALTEKGDTICDANLELTVTDPDLNVHTVPVEQSGACGKNNVTDIPDYIAHFTETSLIGKYQIALVHRNIHGEQVHRTSDSFVVEEYIPYDITRTAPTRIYPPAPYTVELAIKANRSFTGDITERVPRGFVIETTGSSTLATYPTHTEIVWHDVVLKEGDEITLSYTFDAPDVSPYLYLLGPLDMDGFKELREWQIASDALGAVAWLTGFETLSGTELNQTASPVLWSTSTFDGIYFDHSTSTEEYKLTMKKAGDYLVSLTVPVERTDANSSRTRIGAEVRVNGVVVPTGYGRSSYIRNTSSQNESSSHLSFLLTDIAIDDYVEVYLEGLTTIDAGDNVIMSGEAGMYVEYISSSENVFAATTTRSVASTSLNMVAPSEMEWSETRQDGGFIHSDAINPEDITIVNPGAYLVTINIPITVHTSSTCSACDERNNILGRVLLDGAQVAGGQFAQGYTRGPDQEGDADGSIHWFGVVIATTTNQVLSVSVEREAINGVVTVTPNAEGSIFVQELPSTDIIQLQGRDLSGGTDWSDTPAESILWDTQNLYDTSAFTHSTTTNSDDIVVDEAGDYLLVYSDALNSTAARGNVEITVEVNGTPVEGAQTKSQFTRDATSNETSGTFMYLLEGLAASSTITIFAEQEGVSATINDSVDATVLLWKKAELNLRPSTFTFYDRPFDNIRFASTTPVFEFSTVDPDGASSIEYQFSISTTSDFTASTTRTSGVDSGFANLDTPAETSPFTEGDQIQFALQSGDALTDGLTYYWRVRAKDTAGSNEYGDWSTVQSLTVALAADIPEWYQTFDGQFGTNVLTGARVSGNDSVEVDVVENSEILLVYGEDTVTTPRYRVWNGSVWGPELSAQNVGGTNINWVKTAAGTQRDEYTLVTLGDDGDVNAQVYTASTSSWGNLTEISVSAGDPTRGGIAVAYETLSGDSLVVGCDSGADPVYTVWNGSSWSATSSINVTTSSACNWIEMASSPISDEIVLVYRGVTDNYEAFVWDGSAWGNAQILGAVGGLTAEGLDVIYEESGEQAIVVTTDGGDNEFVYNVWDGLTWDTTLNVPHDADFENGHLTRDEGSDQVALCLIDSATDIQVILWDGSAWGSYEELTASGNGNVGRPVECEFETSAGRDGYLIAPYSDNVDDQYQVYDTSSWSGELDLANITDSWFVQTERAGDGTIIALFFDDVADDLLSTVWNGTSWTNSENLENSPSGVNPNPRYESFSMSAKVFQYAVGTVRSNPVDFSFVPNQPTWGDIIFSATEPAGTDLTLQVYYSNSGVCDTLIPDGVLSGNGSGFDAASSPIDLSGISTTTYNEICVEATVTTSGGSSATLDEWLLSWVREPKLIQNNYRWYDNLSSFTPTDPWPAGANDLSENEAVTSAVAVSDGDVLRLRMSVLGSNVDLATSSETFKLQYAEEGSSCSPSLTWFDVGEVGSTTALWRGYNNSIVGDDWYSGSWERRIEITIDSTDVDEDLTDFPVYVDLGDLPATFFANVQNDGDDIRVTEDDGLSEVPFELVSIDTGAETGELHFKADLSSVTDTSFYIYYDNPSASGYAEGDTYGAENVWTNNFLAVYHLEEDAAGTGNANLYTDSTANDYDGDDETAAIDKEGQLGRGQQFNELVQTDYIDLPYLVLDNQTNVTQTWWHRSSTTGAQAIVSGATGPAGTGNNEYLAFFSADTTFAFYNDGGNTSFGLADTISDHSDDSWHYFAVHRDDTANQVNFFVDGAPDSENPNALTITTLDIGVGGLVVGQEQDSLGGGFDTAQNFEGLLDELRFANVLRSSGWISTEYNNQANPNGFYELANEELVSDGRQLPSVLLTESDLPETYEQESPTASNLNAITVGTDVEWDFVLQNNGASGGTDYCFRVIYDGGGSLFDYVNYPTLATNGPPDAPTLYAPFDNEQLASTTPWFEFEADDPLGDEIAYQIQVDTDSTFGSPDIDRNSISHFLLFENIANPSDKSPFDSGQTIRFVPTTPLTAGPTTYWWRVRATDPDASGTYGEWSTAYSFTVDSGTTITTWYQTTAEQFATGDLDLTTTTSGGAELASGETIGTTTSTGVDYDDVDSGNAWGALTISDTLNGGALTYYVEYESSTNVWDRVPNSELPGNGTGFTSADSPIALIGLDTDVYNTLRVVAVHQNTGGNPRIDDLTITWGLKVEKPTLTTPFDNAKVATQTPAFTFTTSDPQSDTLAYEFQLSASSSFAASSTYYSSTSPGFLDLDSVGSSSPYISGHTIEYTIQSPLTSSSTYWWRVRAIDPFGENTYSLWSDPRSFTVDESISQSTWFQTTGDQFDTDTQVDIDTTGSGAPVTAIIRQAIVAYSEIGSYYPRYRLWNGSVWGDELTAQTISAYAVFMELEANPTRSEYALATLGDDLDLNIQIYNGASSTWGNVYEFDTNVTEYSNDNRPFDIAYEQTSGDLMVVLCNGTEAEYVVWDGSMWSATSSISLKNSGECRWVELASDPVGDELLAGFRHVVNDVGGNASEIESEFLVWSGSWGNSLRMGQLTEDDSLGIAIKYEESGDEAMVIASNRDNASFYYDRWDGAAWVGSTTETIADDFEWGYLAQDKGTDSLLLCYVDNAQDLGVNEWDGSTWGGYTEYETTGETKDARPVACEYQAELGTDGNAFVVYSDSAEGRYQTVIAGVPQGETDLSDTRRSDTIQTIRTEDGVIHAAFNEHVNPDSHRVATWDGNSWSTTLLTSTASKTTRPFSENLAMAARKYPVFDSATLRSTSIDFDDGTGPRWEDVQFVDTTPGSSQITYQVYYESSPDTFILVPDAALPGNSSGTTTSPIDISGLDRTTYNVLQLQANYTCSLGNCPTLEEWQVRWSEGLTVSGIAYEYDESTLVTSGTVGVAVNGVLQSGKTGTIEGDGTWSISNVTIFPGDTIMVFVDGAVDEDEAVGVTTYDGVGDVSGIELSKRHLSVGSDDNATTTNAAFAGYDYTDDEDIFFTLNGSNELTLCSDGGCGDAELKILGGDIYQPGANSTVHDFESDGFLLLNGTTFRVGGSWFDNGTTTVATSTVIFTATSTTETLHNPTTTSPSLQFNNVTFGETSGSASWTLGDTLDVNGALTVSFGTLARATTAITVASNLTVGAAGLFSGMGTTTFDGTGTSNWTDSSATSTNIGNVVVNGTSKTVRIQSNVRANHVRIGADDILRGGTGNTLFVEGNFTNTNSFVADTGTVSFVATTTAYITSNNSSFYNLDFDGVAGNWYFTGTNVTVSNDFTIATGTITLPTGTTTIGGSFVNATGTFAHNNGAVRFTSTGSEVITLAGSTYLNALYNVKFTGSGTWTFTEQAATTSHNFIVTAGNVVLPSGTFSVGGDFETSGTGAFTHSSGEVILQIQNPNTVRTNGSSFNDVRVRSAGGTGWYSELWTYRIPITIAASEVDENLTNFPVYVDLADLNTAFFGDVNADGGDIRITESDGTTEVPREIVSIDTGLETGELYFRATSVSSTTDTTFYIYYDNDSASDYADTDLFGAENVWTNGYVLVEHMDDLTTSTVLNSATSTFNGTKVSANNPPVTTSGKIGDAQDFIDGASDDSIAHGNILGNSANISFSAWFNPDELAGSGDTATYGRSLFAISPSGQPYTWLTAGGTGFTSELRICAWENTATACTGTSGANLATGNWYHVSLSATDGGVTTVRLDGAQVLSYTNDGEGSLGANFTIADLRPSRNIGFDGRIDEVRAANVTRTTGWMTAEYRNFATTTDFYTAGSPQVESSRIFSSTNVSVLGDLIVENGIAVFPTGVLSVGGSFSNTGRFEHSSGTVRFNSTSGSETVDAGESVFATLDFNSATGDWTVTENATATVAVTLTDAAQFTLSTGRILETTGTFTNSVGGASTTWVGSELRLTGGTDFALNTKTDVGDGYGTLTITGDGDISMWNSSSTVYAPQSTASIYSQDHDGSDGSLAIFGDYVRSSGTEHWSYLTDFDGVSLGTSSARQANIFLASGSTFTQTGGYLSVLGSTTATTTIDALSGTYTFVVSGGTTTANYYSFTGMDSDGVQLTGAPYISSLNDGLFTVSTVSGTGITIASTTIDANLAKQLFRVDFATTTPIAASNVTLAGGSVSTSYWWFKESEGNIAGEDFDASDLNPGDIRWDNSSYSINISGVLYDDDGVTPYVTPTPLRLVVDGGTSYDTVTTAVTGAFTFSSVSFIGDPIITAFVNSGGSGPYGAIVSKTPTVDITDFNMYLNRVMTRHEDTESLTIADMAVYDETNDPDIPFVAATGTPDTLTVRPDTELIVASSTTFTPGGNIVLQSGGSGNAWDGSFHIDDNATFVGTDGESYSIGGSFFRDTDALFSGASTTLTFTATTTGKTITSDDATPVRFATLSFTGVGGGWNLNVDTIATNTVTMATGTLTGTGDLTILGGDFTGDGLVSFGGGTVLLEESNTFGGAQNWTLSSLTLGNGTVTGTTTPVTNGTTTVSGVLTIATGHYLDAGNTTWLLSGAGSVFVENGTFIEDTSTVVYGGATGSTILSTEYYDLRIAATAGTPTYTFGSAALNVLNDFTVSGDVTTTATLNTNDPLFQVDGDVYIGTNGVLVGSNSALLIVLGSWDNDGIYTANSGDILFDSAALYTIAAGQSAFGDVTVSGTGLLTITEHATSTGVFTLATTSQSVLASGNTLAVGGSFRNNAGSASTTWTDTVLYLYGGGDYTVNGKTVTDTYGTILIGAGTEVRMWNSDAATTTVDVTGSLYSMDHSDVPGDLYVYGAYTNESRNDYWSYATDFDGASLVGGNERQANVYVATSSSLVWTGGSLTVLGTSTASTTIQNQGVGTYRLRIGGSTSTSWRFAVVRDMHVNGLTISGTPTVTNFANLDLLAEIDDASIVTIGGSAITANPAKNFNGDIFNADIGVSGAVNVTATGTTLSAWRFTGHSGNLAGEDYDADPDVTGDPGYIIWDDSAAIISISGKVYQNDGISVSTACDNTTRNIMLAIDGSIAQNASSTCSSVDGSYTISNISFSANDTLTIFINGEPEVGATVSVDPISSIADMDVYEDHVILRHENTDPITIADIAVYDSTDDSDIPFTAGAALTLPSDTKLIVWTSKEFAPGGDVTVPGGGGGGAYDGSLELFANSTWTGGGGEQYTVGGSMVLGSGATLDADTSTFTFVTSGAGRTIDVNNDSFYDLTFNGSGSWNITDSALSALGDITIANGAVTLPNGTTTVGGSFDNTGGSFDANGGVLYFVATAGGNTIEAGGSDFETLKFNGIGGAWSFTDTYATSTGSTTVTAGTLTLPSGTLAVGGDFIAAGSVVHNSGTLRFTDTSGTSTLTLSGNDLYSVTTGGAATYVLTDTSGAFLGDLVIEDGTFVSASGTLSIGGSFDATGGVFTHSSGTLLFNSTDGGEVVNPGDNLLADVQFSSVLGGWTLRSATTTGNFSLVAANSFTMTSGEILTVNGVFTNTVGGGATTWSNSTIKLLSGTQYTLNTKALGGDVYSTLELQNNTDVRTWNSNVEYPRLSASSSLYSQDNAAVDGDVYIYGDFRITDSATEYWSYATDFDGAALSGVNRRPVEVTVVSETPTTTAVVLEETGTLQIVGETGGATTTIIAATSTDTFPFSVTGGTFNAQYYAFDNLDANGLNFSGTTTIVSLSDGHFELATDFGTLITLSSTTLTENASKVISRVNFNATTTLSGFNVTLVGTTLNFWNFQNTSGSIGGEAYDVDGATACGSLRWSDSTCQLVSQTHFRWRNDDGGEGAYSGEWFDTDWTARKRVRIENEDATTYATTAVKVQVTYDSDMQSDFEDLRFTETDGVTEVPYWIERYTDSTSADVWVQVLDLPSDGQSNLFMYYGNVVATTTSSSTLVFNASDDFEDGNISEYAGDTGLFTVAGTFDYGGAYGLDMSGSPFTRAPDGIYRNDITVSQGEIIRYMQYVDLGSGSSDEACTMFGVQSPGSDNENYAVCLEIFGTDHISLVRDVESTDSYGSVVPLASSTLTYATGWYEVEIDWQTDDTIDVTLYNSAGTAVASTSAVDSTYTSGGIGFTAWGQHGGWDGYVSYDRTDTKPTVTFGVEQGSGGATWASDLDTAGGGFEVGEVARVRISIENTGLDLTDQEFRLEYAPRGASPSCASVNTAYTAVPPQASCSGSAVCMVTSSNITNGDSTTDRLEETTGTFSAGEMVESPNNKTGALDLDQNYYTEVEYAVAITNDATDDAYCFKVTDDGDSLDSYDQVAELALQFTPTVTSLSLNGGLDIDLTPGTTTTVYATGTISDLNGYTDLGLATTTIYRSGVSDSCSADNNNCYVTTTGGSCSYSDCSGTSCDIVCIADIYYHAEPTDIGTYAAETWRALLTVVDSSDRVATGSAPSIDLLTLRALDVDETIDYGTLAVQSDTGSYNASTTVENIGNDAIDILVQGSDLSDGDSSIIPVSEQIFSTSTFTYSACTFCSTLGVVPTGLEVDLTKPTSTSTPVTDDVYWGIHVPFGVAGTAHQGLNIFYATAD